MSKVAKLHEADPNANGGQVYYAVVQNIEMPPRTRRSVYNFDKLEVGDGFHFPPEKKSSVASAAYMRAKKHGEKYQIDGNAGMIKRIA